MFFKYAKLERNGTNYKAKCMIDGSSASGFNSTFFKSHLPKHFGSKSVGPELINAFRSAFPKEKIVIQRSVERHCPPDATDYQIEKPTKLDFENALVRFVVSSALPFSIVDKPAL